MAKKRILVLGAGLVGKPMAHDLAKDKTFEISIADFDPRRLQSFKSTDINPIEADLSQNSALYKIVEPFDYVINAVPGSIGFSVLRKLIEAGKDVVDIAFYPEDMFDLHDLAVQNRACVICDMGVAPGMSHMLSGYAASKLDTVHKILIYVGGLPVKREWPWQYKAVFSPADVIEEYTRPARLVENSQVVIKEALSEAELLHFDPVGTLEAFNSDGLRSLVSTIEADYMAEKTLRYPGHIEYIKVLKASGFFENKMVEIGKDSIVPLEFTKKMLFDKWLLKPGEADLTLMKIIVQGKKANRTTTYTYDLYDTYDHKEGIHSMARTTGYAATVALRMMEQGVFNTPGVHAPEQVGQHPACVDFMLKGLKARNIMYRERVTEG